MNEAIKTVTGSRISGEQRSKIIRKPWGRADGIRSAKRARARAEIIRLARLQAEKTDARTAQQVAQITENAEAIVSAFEAQGREDRALIAKLEAPITRHGKSLKAYEAEKELTHLEASRVIADRAELARVEAANKTIDDRRARELENSGARTWEAIATSAPYTLFAGTAEGSEVIFVARNVEVEGNPGPLDGGYFSIATALSRKGLTGAPTVTGGIALIENRHFVPADAFGDDESYVETGPNYDGPDENGVEALDVESLSEVEGEAR